MKIKTKIFITILFSSVVLLLLATLLVYSSEKKILKKQVFNQLQSVASLQNARLESIIVQNMERLQLVASRTQLRLSLEKYLADRDKQHQEKMIRILQDAKSSIKSFRNISILLRDGSIAASTAPSPFIDNIRLDYSLIKRAQNERSADTLFINKNNNLLLQLGGPLHLNGQLLGVIIIESDIDNIISSVSNYSGLGQTGEIIVVNTNEHEDTLFLFPTRFDQNAALHRELNKEALDLSFHNSFTKANNVISTGLDYRDQKVLTVANTMKVVNWTVLVKIDESEAYADIIHTRNVFIMVGVSLLAIAALISFFVSQSITRPIIHLTNIMQKVSGGDLSLSINKTSNDEIGILSQSFNAMLQKRKEAEEEALHAKEEWERTFNAIGDIITILDKDRRIVRANQAAYSFFKTSPQELHGKLCHELFCGTADPCEKCPMINTCDHLTIHSETIAYKHLGMIFNITTAPLVNEKGEFEHVVHIAKDVTDHRKMEAQLLQSHKMEAIGTLAGGIAHDFNNILAAILGYAEMATDDIPEGTDTRNFIDEILKAGNRAKDLVKQILTFSRKGQETKQPLHPSQIITDALKLIRASLPTTIEIQEEIAPDCGSIIANPTNIQQVLVNLCTNALHSMEDEKGILTVKLTRKILQQNDIDQEPGVIDGVFVELLVRDTGCGIDTVTSKRIFEPYFTTKEFGKGTGMGLALVHGIVQNSGGFIKVESKLGQGTTFRVYFPVLDDDHLIDEEHQQGSLPIGNERILVVDDERPIVDMFKANLEKQGYQVSGHCSSIDALSAFNASPGDYDLILTDQTMPHLPGADLAREVLHVRPDIPIILCTGHSTMISEEKAQEIGIKRFVMKPVTRESLAKIVREVLDNSNLPAA